MSGNERLAIRMLIINSRDHAPSASQRMFERFSADSFIIKRQQIMIIIIDLEIILKLCQRATIPLPLLQRGQTASAACVSTPTVKTACQIRLGLPMPHKIKLGHSLHTSFEDSVADPRPESAILKSKFDSALTIFSEC